MKKLVVILLLSACSPSVVPAPSKTLVSPAVSSPAVTTAPAPKTKEVRRLSLSNAQVVLLQNEIADNVYPVIDTIDKLNEDSSVSEIYLLINSPGGSVLDGARLLSAMESSSKPIYTVCTNLCASMAAIIHQYGTKRLMLDRAALMFHDASGGLQGSIPQMRSRLDFYDRMTTKMDAYIAARAGISLPGFLNSLHSEIWIDAEDSTAAKFNDEIVYISLKDFTGPASSLNQNSKSHKQLKNEIHN